GVEEGGDFEEHHVRGRRGVVEPGPLVVRNRRVRDPQLSGAENLYAVAGLASGADRPYAEPGRLNLRVRDDRHRAVSDADVASSVIFKTAVVYLDARAAEDVHADEIVADRQVAQRDHPVGEGG